jgi:Na+/melibiose symporter-like transporter
VFWVNVPVGALVIAGVALTLLPGTRTVPRPRLDLPGAFTVTLAMTALVYGISQATEVGWLAGQVVGSLVGSVLLFVVFVIIESRVGQPLVRLNIFRLRGVRMGNLVMLCLGATLTATLYLLALYFEHVLGYTALRAGLGLLPMAAALCAGALTARRLLAAGVRHLPTGGTVLTIAGFALLTRLPAHTAYLSHVLAPTLLLGAGFAGMILPVVTATTSGIAPADAGLAAGLVNVARQVGGALGLAILVTIATSVRHRGSTLSLAGYHAAFAAAAVINLLATGAAIVLDHVPDAAAAR